MPKILSMALHRASLKTKIIYGIIKSITGMILILTKSICNTTNIPCLTRFSPIPIIKIISNKIHSKIMSDTNNNIIITNNNRYKCKHLQKIPLITFSLIKTKKIKNEKYKNKQTKIFFSIILILFKKYINIKINLDIKIIFSKYYFSKFYFFI